MRNRRSGNIPWFSGLPIESLEKPQISYIYYCYNVVKERGEETVRTSFESLMEQSDDILVIDHDSEDNIKELAEEFGFRYFNVPKTKGFFCHHSKMINKSIIEAKYDIYVQAEVDFVYPNNLSYYILSFYNKHNIKKENLFIRCFYLKDGKLYGKKNYQRTAGALRVYWKQHLIDARGIDERCGFGRASNYMVRLFRVVFGCRIVNSKNYFLVHRDHEPFQNKRTSEETRMYRSMNKKKQLILLKQDLKTNKKLVHNSYW